MGCSSTGRQTAASRACQPSMWTRAWAWSVSPPCCRARCPTTLPTSLVGTSHVQPCPPCHGPRHLDASFTYPSAVGGDWEPTFAVNKDPEWDKVLDTMDMLQERVSLSWLGSSPHHRQLCRMRICGACISLCASCLERLSMGGSPHHLQLCGPNVAGPFTSPEQLMQPCQHVTLRLLLATLLVNLETLQAWR